MAGGGYLFPVLMGLFFVAFLGWVFTVPVEPAPEDPTQRSVRASPGDLVTIEVTGWYGPAQGDGWVFFSTQEERRSGGETFPEGALEPRYETSPVPFRLGADAAPGDGTLAGEVLGHKVGEPFTTARIPPEDAFGDWELNRAINRSMPSADLAVTLGDASAPWASIGFPDYAAYQQFWSRNGVTLAPGTEFPCEGPDVWRCRVESIDPNAGVLTYERQVTDGQTLAISDILGPIQGADDVEGTVEVVLDPGGETFRLVVTPVVGDVFQLRQSTSQLFEAGTWRITAVDLDTFSADYSPNAASAPGLIGQHIWYDLVIVAIAPAEPTPSPGP